MDEDAAKIPEGENVKMVFRHSFRDTLQGTAAPDLVPLNENGVQSANSLGNELFGEIGQMHSSHAPRCIQTLECISQGKGLHLPISVSKDILGDGFATDRELASMSFRSIGSLKKVADLLAHDVTVKGFRPIRQTVKSMLDYIFNNGNEPGKIDLYCTHDFHIALMICLIFNQNSHKDIASEWPCMLEGFFAWGTRKNFTIIWRGRSCHCVNFLA